MVLIFSIKFDYSTTCVIKWLDHWGIKTVRINGDDDIYKFDCIEQGGIYFQNTLTGERVNLLEAEACWWRRTGLTARQLAQFSPPEEFSIDGLDVSSLIKGKNNYLDEETKAIIEYIFYSVYNKAPINLGKPLFNLNRLVVCDLAKKHGLQVPSYKVITHGKQLEGSRQDFGRMVTKAISNGIYRIVDKHRYYTYTELMEEDFFDANSNTPLFPSMVTQLVVKKFEIRTFYIDGQFFSMAIFSQTSEQTRIDFRKYNNNRTEPYRLPKVVEDKISAVLKELDLNCCSMDFIVDDNDNLIFLEINPVGQFGMTSEPCNYNLHKLVAKYLIYGRIN